MTISQIAAVTRQRPGAVGMAASIDANNERGVAINTNPQALEQQTVVIDTAADGTYSIVFTAPFDKTFTFTRASAEAVGAIAAALEALIQADAQVIGLMTVAVVTDTITLTARFPGISATIVAAGTQSANMTVATVTAAASAATLPFGRAVIFTAKDGRDVLGALAAAALFTAQVDTFTVTFEALEIYEISMVMEGETYTVTVLADTNDNDTATAIRTAINARMPANTVIASGGTDQVVLTSEVAGKAFKTSYGLNVSPDVNLALVLTTGGILTDINKALLGVSERSMNTQSTTVGSNPGEYAANAGVVYLKKAEVWIANTETIVYGDPVYVELTAGDDAGKFFAASSATRLRLDTDIAVWRESDFAADGAWDASDAGIAIVEML